jgi:cobyrinic acid a,c-diamide synthase
MPALGPRLVIAGTHSGVGKTTVATGLMAAFRACGVDVASAKVGPDYIDPGYHARATGRPARNLDAWMCGAEAIPALAGRAGHGADLLVVEGVMGLFDGAADGTPSSTADVARLLDAPVVLVVDGSSMSASVTAVVHGYATLDPSVRLAGVILNRIGSPGHETLLREAIAPLGIPVLGALHRDDALTWRDRHLGLVPVVERPAEVDASLDRLAELIARSCDLEGLERLAAAATELLVAEPPLPEPVGRVRLAVAAGPAFSFAYPDNLEALAAAGAEIETFDPLEASALPEGCDGLVAGGGFPEVYGEVLAANTGLLADVADRVRAGLVVWAECGGLLWLATELDGRPMAGVLPAVSSMTERLTLGYRTAVARVGSPLGPAGTELRGHEFHYSTTEPSGDALELAGRFGQGRAGFADDRLLASYLHVHLGAAPHMAEAFVRTAAHGSV